MIVGDTFPGFGKRKLKIYRRGRLYILNLHLPLADSLPLHLYKCPGLEGVPEISIIADGSCLLHTLHLTKLLKSDTLL